MARLLDKAQYFATRALDRLPEFAQQTVAGEPIVLRGNRLSPVMQALLKVQSLRGGHERLSDLSVAQHRKSFNKDTRSIQMNPVAMDRVEERIINTSEDAVKVRVYHPKGLSNNAPAVLFFHGGGMVVGDLDSHDNVCRLFADELKAVLVSVDYGLAPECQYPKPIDHALIAWKWLLDSESLLNIDAKRVAVAGDSAGGYLAAVLCQQAQKEGLPLPKVQALIYPWVDMRLKTPSMTEFGDGFWLTLERIRWFRSQYAPEGTDMDDVKASPLLAESLEGLPPAVVSIAGFDPLQDEGEAYQRKLRSDGVSTTFFKHERLIHGYVNMFELFDEARDALMDIIQATGDYLAQPVEAPVQKKVKPTSSAKNKGELA